jgi:hypothetical protein
MGLRRKIVLSTGRVSQAVEHCLANMSPMFKPQCHQKTQKVTGIKKSISFLFIHVSYSLTLFTKESTLLL